MENIFTLWPSASELASDLGLPYSTVASWKARGHIPARYDNALIASAGARGKTLTHAEIADARTAQFAKGVLG